MLYVIHALGTTLYKIGYSAATPERRLNDLQTGCPYDLKLIFLCEGERSDEAAIHNYMQRKGWRVIIDEREWFDIKQHDWILVTFETGLGKSGLRNKAVSLLSNASEGSNEEGKLFLQWLEKNYKWEKSSSFNTMLGVPFEEVYHQYFMYCAKYNIRRIPGKDVSKMLHDLKIGYKIDDSGLHYFNMRSR